MDACITAPAVFEDDAPNLVQRKQFPALLSQKNQQQRNFLGKQHDISKDGASGLGKLKKFIHLNGSHTRDLPTCSIVP
jgi:hypothetical protein